MLDIMPCRETISYRVAVPELAGQGVLVQVMIFFYSSSIDSYQHGYCIGTIIRPAHSQKYRGDSLYNVALVDDKALEGRNSSPQPVFCFREDKRSWRVEDAIIDLLLMAR